MELKYISISKRNIIKDEKKNMKKKNKMMLKGTLLSFLILAIWIGLNSCKEDVLEETIEKVTDTNNNVSSTAGPGQKKKVNKQELIHLGITINIQNGKLMRSENQKDFAEVNQFKGDKEKLEPTKFLGISLDNEDGPMRWMAKDDGMDMWASDDNGKTWNLEMYSGGKGASEHPYQIGNLRQLKSIEKNPKAHYILIENIVVDSAKMFEPIPLLEGSLDGKNKYIDGIKIENEEEKVGLFKELQGASITNLELRNFKIMARKSAGTLAGAAQNTNIENVHVKKTHIKVTERDGGGFFGSLIKGQIINSSVGENSLIGGPRFLGGISGSAAEILISNSHVKGKIDPLIEFAGGLVANMRNSTIENSYFDGILDGAHYYVGGLIGHLTDSTIRHSYFKGHFMAKEKRPDHANYGQFKTKYVAGFVGRVSGHSSLIEHSYFDGTSTGGPGFVGALWHVDAKIRNSYVKGKIQGLAGFITDYRGSDKSVIENSYTILEELKGLNPSWSVGGFIHTMRGGNIRNSYVVGKITSSPKKAGFLYQVDKNSTVENCYSSIQYDVANNRSYGFIGGIWERYTWNRKDVIKIINSYAEEISNIAFKSHEILDHQLDDKSGYKTKEELQELIKNKQIGPK